jgi:predicted DsbA family dithiol-disulfide isomerase
MKIDIISDTICPWCFIGKRRLARALTLRPQPSVAISWRPYQLNPDMPAEGMERARYLATKYGGAGRATRTYDRVRAAGHEDGIEFQFERIRRTPNTVNSHRLVSFADRYEAQDAVVEALFTAYFIEGRDVGDTGVLAEIAAGCGIDHAEAAAYLASDEDRERIIAEDEHVRLMGITGVPCFVIDERYAISGAQSPEVFFQVFDLVREEKAKPAAQQAV